MFLLQCLKELAGRSACVGRVIQHPLGRLDQETWPHLLHWCHFQSTEGSPTHQPYVIMPIICSLNASLFRNQEHNHQLPAALYMWPVRGGGGVKHSKSNMAWELRYADVNPYNYCSVTMINHFNNWQSKSAFIKYKSKIKYIYIYITSIKIKKK